ncbi:MAG TPA: fatty acid--CoA ligase family protein [Aggregatilineales bacterium]|nr:fatty acid--CoA ligase family protein [Aggregatilineales bacterium]
MKATHIQFMLDRFQSHPEDDAIIWSDQRFSYGWLVNAVQDWMRQLDEQQVPRGASVSLEADFSPNAIALLLALIDRDCILVPLTSSVEQKKPEFRAICEVEVILEIDGNQLKTYQTTGVKATHPMIVRLKDAKHPGLVLFSSGSTGKNKAALHDFVPLLEKFKVPRHSMRTITFLLFDHIGGINTLLYTLSNAGCVITVNDRSPDAVCATIEKFKAELLPTSPTFINLILITRAYERYDLSSLKMITYGTEVMPESTLQRMHSVLPNVNLLQTYGLSEVGILRSKSKTSDSLWMKIGGEGFQTRIVDGLLEIKAESAMLGYLNHESPFTEDGWFKTGDAVEVDGEYIRILGRKSEIINVGGEKVYPAEVESVILQMDGVEDAIVTGAENPIIGKIVQLQVRISTGETLSEFRSRMGVFCQGRLERFKIPQKVTLVTDDLHSERFKKLRGKDGKN